ncbi:unnamed protein product [Allacma fusca]|uniref:SH3b domain-containing protein n=1 Tax=Allacma fusca TaxID=39272 RepID=A0A8J2KUN4_9HEXA|nr:unnamed protein product [Allacma fusca]
MKLAIILSVIAVASCARYTGPTNQAGVNLIKEFEGWYPNFYTDPVGIRTIGYGHACHVWDCSLPLNGRYTPPLTQAQGQELLKSDLSAAGRYEACVRSYATLSTLNANQYSALVSFAFNLGCGSLQTSTLLRLLNAGNVLGASAEFGKWINAGGQVLPGLVRRREAERVLFCSSGGCATGCAGSVAATSLTVRKEPNTSAAVVTSLSSGARVDIYSRTTGSTVNGNNHWFQLPNGYVSAYYITVTSSSHSWCAK